MNAKDTVLGSEIVIPKFPDYIPCAVWDILEAQAKISFKAGFNEALNTVVATREYDEGKEAGISKGYSAGLVDGQYTNHKRHGKKMVKARQEGMQEVVEWIPELIQKIKDAMWEDDWGIKGVIYEKELDSLVKKLIKAQLKKWGVK